MSSIPTIGDVVREWRQYRQISLTDFCQQTKLSKSYVSELEHNKIENPKQDKLERLAAAFGISVMDIVSRRMPPKLEGDNTGGQAVAQSVPVQQPQAAAGIEASVLQQILAMLQALMGAVTQLTTTVAQLAALQQPTTATPTPSDASQQDPEKLEPHPSGEQGHGKAPAFIRGKIPEEQLAEGVREVEKSAWSEVILNWNRAVRPARTIEELDAWDEYWTKVYEQRGSLFVVMKGLQGMTLHKDHYKESIKPILADKEHPEKAKFMLNALDRLERRQQAFETQVQTYVFCHLTPIEAFDTYAQTGKSRIDEYGLVLGGLPTPPHQRAADIHHIIDLLQNPKYDKYHLGLLTGERSQRTIYDTSFWELKGDKILILENLKTGERNIKNSDPMVIDWLGEFFDTLSRSEEVITDREEVIKRLKGFTEKAEGLAQASVRS